MTEKDYNPEQKMKKIEKAAEKQMKTPKKTERPVKKVGDSVDKETTEKVETRSEAKKEKKQTKPTKKKTEAVVNSRSVPISTKYAVSICKFILKKTPEKAIEDLELVLKKKKVVPMKGEYAHQKGKGIAGGKFPVRATEYFIKSLKTLQGNATVNGIEEPIIVEAIANKARRPLGRFGRVQKKRTHLKIIVGEAKRKEVKK